MDWLTDPMVLARFVHIAMRVRQKSRIARKMTLGLAPVGEPAVRG